MPRPKGLIFNPEDQLSERWPGHLLQKDGRLRRVIKWRNGHANNYYVETTCAFCKKPMLQDDDKRKNPARAFCSGECRGNCIKAEHRGNRTLKPLPFKQGHYVLINQHGHSRAGNHGHVREHLLIMEEKIGRPVLKSERVHHIDLVKMNNDISNLHLCATNHDHQMIHSSLNRCVAELMRRGFLSFNRDSQEYFVPDAD